MGAPGIVVALGGNALAPAGEEGAIADQSRHTRESLGAIVDLAAEGWNIAIVHGNGPQVGNALIQQELARDVVPPLPLGVLVAATQGWIGYMVQQSLQNALARAGVARQVVTVVTQVEVDIADPEFEQPTKAVGKVLEEAEAQELARRTGALVTRQKGGWRRLVPSPVPISIIERPMIDTLFRAGHLVIAAGGGGTPVHRDSAGKLEGVDAVVDKDRAAAVLARDLRADTLLILTDVEAVFENWGRPDQRPLRRLTVAQGEELLRTGQLGAGTMAPKVEAASEFVRYGGDRAVITKLELGREGVAGRAGTEIVPD